MEGIQSVMTPESKKRLEQREKQAPNTHTDKEKK
jgi:hypothetical protein